MRAAALCSPGLELLLAPERAYRRGRDGGILGPVWSRNTGPELRRTLFEWNTVVGAQAGDGSDGGSPPAIQTGTESPAPPGDRYDPIDAFGRVPAAQVAPAAHCCARRAQSRGPSRRDRAAIAGVGPSGASPDSARRRSRRRPG